MGKVNGPAAQLIAQGHFTITYEDDGGDIIQVSDDEDLMAAYDVAENFLNRQLKLQIKPDEASAIREPQREAQIDSSKVQVHSPEQLRESVRNQLDDLELEDQIDPNTVKMAIQEIVLNKDKPDESMSEESDPEENAQKGKGKKRGKKNKEFGGLPRKCFKRLIKKELDK